MSIICSVRRLRPFLALVGAALVLAGVPTALPAVAAPIRSAPDVPARLATLQALEERRSQEVTDAISRRDDVRRRLDTARGLAETARARTDQLSVRAAEAAARYETARRRVGELAAVAYRGGADQSQLMMVLDIESLGDYAYRRELVERVGERQRNAVRTAQRERATATALADEARAERNRLVGVVDALTRALPDRETAVTTAQVALARVEVWRERWEAIAGGTATTIMGRPALTPDELATWFTATRRRARLTVSISELARYYVEEGSAVGVRGDIAFAQSILETGSLWFPDGGQVLPTDNNFAGMGACDSCASGDDFPDARTGVRAQVQQLRVYADPSLTNAMLNPPAVNPRLDAHFLKGRVPTWGGLTHTWATASTYGDRILAIYGEILAWHTDRARL